VPIGTWLLAIGLLLALGLHLDGMGLPDVSVRGRAASSRHHWPELASVLGLTAVGFAMRYYDVDMIPPAFHGDEGFMGLFGLEILEGQRLP
jgi:hypothetical protein